MPKADVERQFVIDLPNRPDQSRERVRSAELLLVKKFGHRAYDPLGWSFDDQISKDVCPLITRKLDGVVQVNGSPVPPLRYYGVNGCAITVVPIAVRQQNTELCSDAGTGLILKRARANDVLQGSSRCRQIRWARRRER